MSQPPRLHPECRCLCGSLLARRVERGVELKCRRCKRTLIVPLAEAASARPSQRWNPPPEAR